MTKTIRTMKRKLILSAVMMTVCIGASAQSVANAYKGDTNANPISPCVFCADPTALEYNGRLYVYGSNDHQQFIKNGKKGENTYGEIKSIVVFSTDDMVNWTFHGTIDTKKICSSWVTNPWYQGLVTHSEQIFFVSMVPWNVQFTMSSVEKTTMDLISP